MNKSLVLVLAICLVSVHAFVKRDAATEPSGLDKLQKTITDGANVFGEELKKAFDPDNIKKNWNELTDGVNKAIENLKPKETPKA